MAFLTDNFDRQFFIRKHAEAPGSMPDRHFFDEDFTVLALIFLTFCRSFLG